jgi:DNA (cytosine-5)-methyltransferase 1
MTEPTCLEIFSGGGGLALGSRQAGFRHVSLVEINKHARATLQANGVEPLHAKGDIKEIDFSGFEGKVDLVAGGPPCQPFSLGGAHRGDLDDRNMFPEAIRVLREVRPKAFLFENVRGLARPSFSKYLEYIKLQLMSPGLRRGNQSWEDHASQLKKLLDANIPRYSVEHRVICCADYGAPQTRYRVIFLGSLSGLDIPFPEPTHDKDSWVTVRDVLDDLHAELGQPAQIPSRVSKEHSQHVFVPGARVYGGHTGSPLDLPAKAIKAGVHGVPGGENMLRNDDGSVRYFTVREAAALQGFPNDYMFEGPWGEAMRQIGNAVPVMVAKKFCRAIRACL